MKELMKKLRNTKGISLITLSVAVSILIIITGTLIYSAKDTLEARNLKNMYNDIELLEDKVESYYIKYGGIPVSLIYNIDEYTNLKNFIEGLEDNIDDGNYYVIDLAILEGITSLNYGRDYEYIKDKTILSPEDYSKYTDIYIMNELTHQIYYVRGVESDGKRYHTNELKTQEDIAMRITIIDSIEDLVRFEQDVNGGKTFEGEYVVLTRNLDFKDNNSYDGSIVNIVIDEKKYEYKLNGTNDLKSYLCEGGTGWTPIGWYSGASSGNKPFYGIFNGNNYTISNLYINNTEVSGQGLFAYIGNKGTVENIIVSGKIEARRRVGGIAAYSRGKIENCINKCEINITGTSENITDEISQAGGIVGLNAIGGQVIRCKNEGNITAVYGQVGGIVGLNSSIVTDQDKYGIVKLCCNEGNIEVTGKDNFNGGQVGGIVGLNGNTTEFNYDGEIIDCYNTGNIKGLIRVGGIVGDNNNVSRVENCYNIGNITAENNRWAGAICGQKTEQTTITNTFYLVGISKYGIGDIDKSENDDLTTEGDKPTDEGAEPRTSEYMKTSDFVALLEGTDEEKNWKLAAYMNNGYPILEWQEGNKVILEHDTLIINSIEDLVRFEQAVNGTFKENINDSTAKVAQTFEGKTVILNRNLDFEDNNSYDGTNVIIDNKLYKLNGTNDLKKYLCEGGTGWTSIGKYRENNESNEAIKKKYFSGTFDGRNYTISNLYINNTSTWGQGLFGAISNGGSIKNLTVSGNIRAIRDIGGIVAYIRDGGTVENCTNKCDIYSIGDSKGGYSQVGGIVGVIFDEGNIKNCINEGKITGKLTQIGGIVGLNRNGNIDNSYNKADVKLDLNDEEIENLESGTINAIGGIAGANGLIEKNEGKISNCYNTGAVRGAYGTGGIVGRNGQDNATGLILNCYNLGSITGKTSTGGITGGNGYYGGTGKVSNCYNKGIVVGSKDNTGGIVGINGYDSGTGEVLNCYNIERISGYNAVGGIIGLNGHTNATGKISNCYNIAKITSETSYEGGIIGFNGFEGATGIVSKTYYLVGTATYGIGDQSSDIGASDVGAEPKTSEYMKTSDFVTLLEEGEDEEKNWKLVENKNNGYPILEWQEGNEVVIAYDSLVIRSIEELVRFEQEVNKGTTFAGKTVILNRDLDFANDNSYDGTNVTINGTFYKLNGTNDLKTYLCEGGTGWTTIGKYGFSNTADNRAFSGVFDGKNYEISNFYLNNMDKTGQGLFGYISSDGMVKNLEISGKITTGFRVGAIAGYSRGIIENCINNCDITSNENSYNASQARRNCWC